MLSVALAIAASKLPTLASAYSWNFKAAPKQCSDLTIAVSGNDGKPPYRVLIVPFGPSPLSNNIEARRIIDHEFSGSSTETTFKLKYPKDSQLVAIVSDATGFGSGGTSVAAQVIASDDSSCFDSSQNVSPQFVFSIDPQNQVVQCQPMRLFWDRSKVEGTPNFVGVIPGGQSFAIPRGEITDRSNDGLGTGFSWTPSIRGGTTLMIIGGDNRGNGTGGSILNTVSTGVSNDGSCLKNDSPSSTPGSPAGGTYPTSSSGAGVGGGSTSSSSNTGAIVGGVVGAIVLLVALILLLLFYRRRKRLHRRHGEKPNLLQVDDGDDDEPPNRAQSRNELPQYYQPEPFMVPDPTLPSSSEGDRMSSDGRRVSLLTSTDRSGTPDLLGGSQATSRKGGYQRSLRPVNIIQHDDAGPSEMKEEEAETIELPPAYTHLKPSSNASTPATTT